MSMLQEGIIDSLVYYIGSSIFCILPNILSHFFHSSSGSLPFNGNRPPPSVSIFKTRWTASLMPTIPHLPTNSSAELTEYCSFRISLCVFGSIGPFSDNFINLDTVLGYIAASPSMTPAAPKKTIGPNCYPKPLYTLNLLWSMSGWSETCTWCETFP